jgi:site-specific DNA-methyltransferase (adenine-specific)
MGSGSVGVAAVRLGRDFHGTDICDEALELSETRLRAEGAVPEETADSRGMRLARSG